MKQEIIYFNSQSLISNFGHVQIIADIYKPDIIMITESCVTQEINQSEITIKGYGMLRCDSHSRHTGGVAMYIKKGIKYTEIEKIVFNNNVWLLSTRISTGFSKGLHSVLYHSPSTSNAEFLAFLENWCDENVNNREMVTICGDFNIDVSVDTVNSNKLKSIIVANGMKQIVNSYTRITKDSQTLIDLVLTNATNASVSVCDYKVADHETLKIAFNNNLYGSTNKQICVWDHSAYSGYKYRNSLLQYDWNEVNGCDLQTKASMLVAKMQKCYFEVIGKKFIVVRSNNPWYSSDLNVLQRERDSLYRVAKCTNREEDWINYKNSRNYYNKLLKATKNTYYEKQINGTRGDSRKMWKKLKELIKNSNGSPEYVEFPGGPETEDESIASQFNDYFVDSIMEIHDSIDNIVDDLQLNNIDDVTMVSLREFETINADKLIQVISAMKNKSSTDHITPGIISDAIPVIGETLLGLINESLRSGIVPKVMKISTVIPVPKISNAIKCSDFRPINMLPALEKILEEIVKNQLELFIEKNGILADVQSGFRRDHSCETALNLVLANWKEEIENGNKVVSVFLDLRRAFETIDRNRLLQKLKSYGIKDTVLKWIEDYLTDRSQTTRFANKTSEHRNVTLGVPQGSKLGPLLFVLYINDIVNFMGNCKLNMFADDMLISAADVSADEAINIINNELLVISKWLKINKLKINTDKTKAMVICNKKPSTVQNNVTIDDVDIEFVDEIKYLGVVIDYKLTFKNHVNYIVKKVAKKIGFFGRISSNLGTWARIVVYGTIIAPHFEYCASVLLLVGEGDMCRLQKLQNKAMRIILTCNRYTRVSLMLDALQWLSVRQRIYFNSLVLVYKIIKNKLPQYLNRFILYNSEIHDYNTRIMSNFRLPLNKKSSSQNSLFYKGLKMYNSMSYEARQSSSIHQFRKHCSQFVKDTCKI